MRQPEDHRVVFNHPYLPFHGLTQAKARLLNSAFCGLRVEVIGGQHRISREVYMFLEITLPGQLAPTPISVAYELVLLHYDATTKVARPGSSRHVTPDLVESFRVVDPVELTPCWQCCRWCEPSALRDTAGLYWYPGAEDGWQSRLECRDCRED